MASLILWRSGWRRATRHAVAQRYRTARLMSHRTPVSVYESLVTNGTITDNASQRVVLTALKTLFHELDDYKPSQYFEADAQARKTARETSPDSFARSLLRLLFQKKDGIDDDIMRDIPHTAPRGLYIYGSPGSSLEHCLVPSSTLNTVVGVKRKKRVHFNSFMLSVHDRIHKWRLTRQVQGPESDSLGVSEGFDPIPPLAKSLSREAYLLCFDEFQVTDIADAMILKRLFDHLFQRGVVVVATSNRAPDQLYKNGLQRDLFLPFIEMLQTRCQTLHLESGVDFRTVGVHLTDTFFYPQQEGKRKFDEAFAAVTEAEKPRPRTIAVMQGRQLDVPCAVRGIARFSFVELCRKALGAADYSAIAKEFHTVFIEDIPYLSVEQRNELRRFITLVDELYQAKTRLVCLAAALPTELFEGASDDLHDEVFAFERCVSRLVEMQSRKYREAIELDILQRS